MKRIMINVFDLDGDAIARRDVSSMTLADFAKMAEVIRGKGYSYRLKALDGDVPSFLGGAL